VLLRYCHAVLLDGATLRPQSFCFDRRASRS
jgi:hypothetical protein